MTPLIDVTREFHVKEKACHFNAIFFKSNSRKEICRGCLLTMWIVFWFSWCVCVSVYIRVDTLDFIMAVEVIAWSCQSTVRTIATTIWQCNIVICLGNSNMILWPHNKFSQNKLEKPKMPLGKSLKGTKK